VIKHEVLRPQPRRAYPGNRRLGVIDHEGYEVYDWKGNKTDSQGKIEGVATKIDHRGRMN